VGAHAGKTAYRRRVVGKGSWEWRQAIQLDGQRRTGVSLLDVSVNARSTADANTIRIGTSAKLEVGKRINSTGRVTKIVRSGAGVNSPPVVVRGKEAGSLEESKPIRGRRHGVPH